jgi:NhaA family Na+:H+ antiporter
VADRARSPSPNALVEFLGTETASAVVLLAATIAALVWANAGASYATFWSHEVTLGAGSFTRTLSRTEWVDEGLMTLFFFVVGLEIKRELVVGDLRDRRHAALPVVAAVGGMAVPAAIYLAIHGGKGWGIPMATDIAFALGAFALVAGRGAPRLRVFLLTLAVVDDLGAIAVIAIISSHGIDALALFLALALIVVMLVMRRLGVPGMAAYAAPAFLLWACVLASGVHATLAGVVLGLLTPAVGTPSPVVRLEHALHPWSSWLIVPLFALANAGVELGAGALDHAVHSTIAWGVFVGLVVGKTVGISAAVALAVRVRIGRLAAEVNSTDVLGVAALGGIGFTVALFTAGLSFSGTDLVAAKVAILSASVSAAVVGSTILGISRQRAGASTLAAPPEEGA